MSLTVGAAIAAGIKGIVTFISSMTIPQALAVGAFVGGVVYTVYVKIKASKKIVKNSKKASTVSQQVSKDFDDRRKGKKTKVDVDALDRDLEDIRTRDIRETDRIYKDILDEIDEDNQVRNRGRKHEYRKRDFDPVKRMKQRDKKRKRKSMSRTIDEELAKFYSDVDDIWQAEEDKKFNRYVGEDDDFSNAAKKTYEADFSLLNNA